jgi:phospholipid/cholesterol/gamma-HCH transport system substrate-binding protein
MENKAHALAAGAFVVLVASLLIALAAWLSRDNTTRDALEFSTRESVTGLQPQAAVRYRGINVGKVESIGFDPQIKGNVLVRLAIDQGTPITKSTFATLGYQGVTGLAYVQLDDPGDSTEALPLSATTVARIPLKPSLLSRLSDQGGSILVQVEETTKRINQLLAPENQKALVGTLQSIAKSAEQVGTTTRRLEVIAEAQLGPQRTDIPALVAETKQAMKTLQASGDELKRMSESFGKTSDELSQTARDMSQASKSVVRIGDKLTEPGGALERIGEGSAALSQGVQTLNANTLPRATRAIDDVAKAARNADRTIGVISDNPQSLIFGNGATPPGPGEPGFSVPTKR